MLKLLISPKAIEFWSSCPFPTNFLPSGLNCSILIALNKAPLRLEIPLGHFCLSSANTFVFSGYLLTFHTYKSINLALSLAAICPVATVVLFG